MNRKFFFPAGSNHVITRSITKRKIAILFSLITLSSYTLGQALFIKPTDFKITKVCSATNSIRSKEGEIQLELGKTYTAFGENSPHNATHIYISINNQRKWVNQSCGEFNTTKPDFKISQKQHNRNIETKECLPFFDEKNDLVSVKVGGSVDVTPLAPIIDTFGNAINEVCGSSGKETSKIEFIKLMKAYPNALSELMKFTGGKVYSHDDATQNPDLYLQKLSEAWYAIHAFDHIFCGETEKDKNIGGLHYYGRYKQLQDNGEACRLPNHKSNEVIPGKIYSMGVRMKKQNGEWIYHQIKGYGLTLSALDILKAATRAFSENPTPSKDSTACLLDVQDGEVKYTTVFVRRSSGIRTFYPDATPDIKNTQPCKVTVKF